MGTPVEPSRAVVVGIDASRAAISAALWAVDEAISRDIPLRLVAVVESGDTGLAERALRAAVTAVEDTHRPVTIDVDLARGRPVGVLRDLSCSADMLCVGTIGVGQATGRHVGSTAAALAGSARCPVALIGSSPPDPRWILAELDESVGSLEVLDRAISEAMLRNLPLRLVAGSEAVIRARLERLLAQYQARHPDLDIRAMHGTTVEILARDAGSVALVVMSRLRNGGTPGPGYPVLICPSSRAL